jgi:hypothetical protein
MKITQPDMAAISKVAEEQTRFILRAELKREPTDAEFFPALACLRQGIALGAEVIKQSLGIK